MLKEKFGKNCASAEAQFGAGRGIKQGRDQIWEGQGIRKGASLPPVTDRGWRNLLVNNGSNFLENCTHAAHNLLGGDHLGMHKWGSVLFTFK